MKTVYLLRCDKNWDQHNIVSNHFNNFFQTKQLTTIWDDLFNISWKDFRIKLRNINKLNQFDLHPDSIVATHEIQDVNLFQDCLVFPTDDDDWFHRDCFDIVKNNICHHQAYRWNYAELTVTENRKHELRVFTYPTNIPYPCWQLSMSFDSISFHYQSNNYALKFPKNLNLLQFHNLADQEIDIRQEKFIPQTLSIHNGSLASCSFLRRIQRRYPENFKDGLVDLLQTFKKDPIKNMEIPYYFNLYIDRMMDLYNELKVR
jgi:hypothetical protein